MTKKQFEKYYLENGGSETASYFSISRSQVYKLLKKYKTQDRKEYLKVKKEKYLDSLIPKDVEDYQKKFKHVGPVPKWFYEGVKYQVNKEYVQ